MSQAAYVELSRRNDTETGRTGELKTPIYLPGAFNMGDVSMQPLTIGDLEFAVMDYGDRLAIPLKIREFLNDGRNVEKNQRSIIHLAQGFRGHLQSRQNRAASPTPPPPIAPIAPAGTNSPRWGPATARSLFAYATSTRRPNTRTGAVWGVRRGGCYLL